MSIWYETKSPDDIDIDGNDVDIYIGRISGDAAYISVPLEILRAKITSTNISRDAIALLQEIVDRWGPPDESKSDWIMGLVNRCAAILAQQHPC